jgi:hypothetical protein
MRRICVRKRLHHNDNPRSAKDAFISRSFGWVVKVVGPGGNTDSKVAAEGGGEEHVVYR